ncbi:TetR/AcrR family transcriptional regulator [bacterium]|nr:TetR/AcrR family transcriptional regulator [bacterium]
MIGRKEREHRLRRRSILEAAQEMFARKGFPGTTMGDVSRQSEFGMSTLYKFFKSKREIYASLIDEHISRLQERLRGITEADVAGEKAIERFIERHLQYFQENAQFFRIYMNEKFGLAHGSMDGLSEQVRAQISRYAEHAEDALRNWIEESDALCGDSRAKALALISTVDAHLSRWLSEGKVECARERASSIVDIFFSPRSASVTRT